MYDLILKGGRVFDASQKLEGTQLDIAVTGGKIARLAANVNEPASQTLDISGRIVTPGLIDLHCHVYHGINDHGIEPDLVGVRSGVTTLVDGGSAGHANFGGWSEHVIPKAKTRILPFMHIAKNGLSTMPELQARTDIEVENTVSVIKANRPLVQGIKIRAIGPTVPVLGIDIVKLALQAATEGGVQLMIHIGDFYIKEPTLTRQLLPLLREGDILTHSFTNNPGRILDAKGKVLPEFFDAQNRGVNIDTAMGRFNFTYEVAIKAIEQGVKPDTLSTDITVPGRRDTVHSLTEMMTRYLALGFKLPEVIAMATTNPAKALGKSDTLGSLKEGREADISVLEEATGKWAVKDCAKAALTTDKALAPVVTVRAGEVFMPDWGPHPWGWLPEQVN
ncbi:MAG: amidohydrolase/deacetylase family metallohydrolase [Chloroflexi bacterium]|nr:amidohydrolase/deacetylase family metallohydrolase [Chloroflexota bacterium]